MSVVSEIKEGEERSITRFYQNHKKAFLVYAKKYDLDYEDLLEVYQDACVIFVEKAQRGLLDELKSSPKTYLFGIGKNLIYKRFEKIKKEQRAFENLEIPVIDDPFLEEENPDQFRLRMAFRKLGNQCREMLELYYFKEKKLDEIQELMNYTDKNVVKSQKSRCLKQLKELVKNG